MSQPVLCLSRSCLEACGLLRVGGGPNAFFTVSASQCAEFDKMSFEWLPRSQCETDRRFKQIIPYILVDVCSDARFSDKVHRLVYQRGSGERRLQALLSLGVGGHVEPIDGSQSSGSLLRYSRQAAEREVYEELGGPWSAPSRLDFLGLVNDDQTDVGAVHLGLVYRWTFFVPAKLDSSERTLSWKDLSLRHGLMPVSDSQVPDNELDGAVLYSLDCLSDLDFQQFESWSQMLLSSPSWPFCSMLSSVLSD